MTLIIFLIFLKFFFPPPHLPSHILHTSLILQVAAGTLTVVATAQGEVMALQKAGELSAPPALMARCVAHAVEGAVDAHAWIAARVDEAIPKQYVRGLTRGK